MRFFYFGIGSSFLVDGRRGFVTLSSILRFATGAEKEPFLGFKLQLSLNFIVADSQNFLPTSNTYINWLNLPRATIKYNLPEQSHLSQLNDYDFSDQYFGQKWGNYITFAQTADSIKHDHVTEIKDFYAIVMLKSKKKILSI